MLVYVRFRHLHLIITYDNHRLMEEEIDRNSPNVMFHNCSSVILGKKHIAASVSIQLRSGLIYSRLIRALSLFCLSSKSSPASPYTASLSLFIVVGGEKQLIKVAIIFKISSRHGIILLCHIWRRIFHCLSRPSSKK